MSLVLHGIAAGTGYAIGKAHLLSYGLDEVPHYSIKEEEIPLEIVRYEDALKRTREQLDALRKNIPRHAPAELGAFISFHLMMVGDVNLSHTPIELIETQKINAEWALRQQWIKLLRQFNAINDDYLRMRQQDVTQVVEKIYQALGDNQISHIQPNELLEDVVLIARDISPADAAIFRDNRIIAFTTDVGGPTSHMAILGKNLQIPSVLGLRKARELIKEDEWIVVDGVNGVVILNPDKRILEEYEEKTYQSKRELRKLNRIKKVSTTSLDGVDIEILANIENLDDLSMAYKNGADGVGLFRSEFLFLNRDSMPSEDEQFEYYRKIVKKSSGKPVTIRTVDMGVDKNPRWFGHFNVVNPAMGLTGIRLSLAEPVMFRTQMRAILRAACYGKLKMMWPMIASIAELKQCLAHLNIAKEQLQKEGLAYGAELEIGIMVEIPSAALSITSLIKLVDFISIGTNDLTQYTLAVDRANDTVRQLYQPLCPAVLKLIHRSIKTAKRYRKGVSICGEMAGDPQLTRVLLGMGLQTFSINASSILPVKNAIVNTSLKSIVAPVNRLLRNDDPDKTERLLAKINDYDKLSQETLRIISS